MSEDEPAAGGVSQNNGRTDVCRVGIRIPAFWPEKPAIWFAQIESQFAISNITADATKFFYVVAQLESQYAAEVEDIIISPPSADKYKRLKTELIKRLSASRQQRMKQVLDREELGDRKPSQFLRHLQHLAGPNIPEDFLISIWTSRLPSNLQSILASQTTESSEVLADLADRVYEVVPRHQVASTSRAADTQVSDLIRQVSELTKEVKSLKSQFNSRPSRTKTRESNESRNRSKSQRSQSSYQKYPTCWYHAKFGENASKCTKPCDFKAGNDRGTR